MFGVSCSTFRRALKPKLRLISSCTNYVLQNTALHFAAIANKPSSCELLLSYNCAIEDNGNGRSPLDIAIENVQVDVAAAMMQHDRWKELLDRASTLYKCPLLGLIQTLPKVHKLVLDRCRQVANVEYGSPNYYVRI